MKVTANCIILLALGCSARLNPMVEANVIYDELWIHRPEGWKLQLTTEGKQTKLLIDGKPSPP